MDSLDLIDTEGAPCVVLMVAMPGAHTAVLESRLCKPNRLVLFAGSSESAMLMLRQCRPQAVVLDEGHCAGETASLMARMLELAPQTRIIRLPAEPLAGTGPALAPGAAERLPVSLPAGAPRLHLVPQLAQSNKMRVASPQPQSVGGPALLGHSLPMRRLRASLSAIRDGWLAQPHGMVQGLLVTGESGTGKACVARSLHAMMGPGGGPFTRVACSTMAPGSLAAALGDRSGMVLLVEPAALDRRDQALLLQLIQREAPAGSRLRLVLSSCHDPDALARHAALDPALRRALMRLPAITVPPLRSRPGDVQLLARHFARQAGMNYGKPVMHLSSPVLGQLQQRPWPGNVRELQNVVEEAVILSAGTMVEQLAG